MIKGEGGVVSQRIVTWSEFLQPKEISRLVASHILIDQQDLEMAAWVADERDGHAGYCGQLAVLEVFVWRDAGGELHWEATYPHYLAQEMLEPLDALLRARGFRGRRRDDPVHHRVIFETEDGRKLDVRLQQHAQTSGGELQSLVAVFLGERPGLEDDEMVCVPVLPPRRRGLRRKWKVRYRRA